MASSSSSSLFHRRDFLKATGALGLGTGLSVGLAGCSTLDRLIMGDFQDESDRVVILGAGLAGLMAAFQLRKQGQQVRVFEASARLGGRAHTVADFFRGQNAAELGGEWFSASDKIILETALELRIEVIDVKDVAGKMKLRRGDRLLTAGEMGRELSRFQKSSARAHAPEALAAQSLADWVRSRSRESAFLDLVDAWALEKFGATAGDVAATALASEFDSARPAYGPWVPATYRFRGGASALAQALFDRTAGFQPERTYSFRHRLRAVRRRSSGIELIFETPEGQRSYTARSVICALPLGCLSEIEGLRDLPGPWNDEAALKMGQHAKFITSYADRFWSKRLDQSKLIGFGEGQTLWESSYRLNPLFQFRQGVLSVLWGGEASRRAGPAEQAAVKAQIEDLLASQAQEPPVAMDQVMVNWALQPFAKGSVSYPRPGEKSDAWATSTAEWAWAGEHTIRDQRATMAGALRSGQMAAANVLATKRTGLAK